ncbi:MAG: NAD(P)-binding protein, partial [Rhodoferax sp.]|nr:NAD(P)-binding protein [Rhodoferax sp.]
MRVAVVGGGWAGLAAAVSATQAGHHVTVFEAARNLGGRARALPCTLPDGSSAVLDNGQHILIGAYSETLGLMRTLGVAPQGTLLRLPLALLFPDGEGLQLPDWP